MQGTDMYENKINGRGLTSKPVLPDVIGNFALGVGSVKKHHVVVDIHAYGNGIASKLNHSGVKVIALDQREVMGLNSGDGSDRVWWKASGEARFKVSLPLESNSVDIVFAELVLHHFQAPSLAIDEIKRILRPGGRLVITEVEKYYDTEAGRAAKDRRTGLYPGDIRHWLKKAGFSNIIVNAVPGRHAGRNSGRPDWEVPDGYLMATGTA